MNFTEFLERARGVGLGVRERLRSERRIERAFINAVPDGAHDTFGAEAVVVVGLVAAAAQVQNLKRARNGGDSPLRVAEVSVTDTEAFKGVEAKEGGEAQFVPKDGVVGDVVIAFDDRNEGSSTDEVGGMQCRAGDTVERKVAQGGDGGGDGDDEPLAPVQQCAAGQCTASNKD